MESRTGHAPGSTVEILIGLIVSAAVAVGWAIQRLVPVEADAVQVAAAPDWLPLVAAAVAGAGILALPDRPRWVRAQGALRWAGLLLMVWAASGLPFDLFTAAGLMGQRTASGAVVMSTVYWPGLATRAFALAALIMLARLTLARPAASASARPATWYGYAAFVFALPYPVLRLYWALGGTLGLLSPGAGGPGWAVLIAIPWAAAAVLSLFLVAPPRWMPRRLLLLAGWTATAMVATIGPAAFWGFFSTLASGAAIDTGEMELWVFGLFYTSWFLWAIAGGAATRSYQVRTAARPVS